MNSAVVCLGSNIADGKEKVEEALLRLRNLGNLEAQSAVYVTPPLSGQGRDYHNAVALLTTADSFETLNLAFKQMEIEMGRDEQARQRGDVPIDIDIVVWQGEVVRPRDYSARFFRLGYASLPQLPWA